MEKEPKIQISSEKLEGEKTENQKEKKEMLSYKTLEDLEQAEDFEILKYESHGSYITHDETGVAIKIGKGKGTFPSMVKAFGKIWEGEERGVDLEEKNFFEIEYAEKKLLDKKWKDIIKKQTKESQK
jgi:hypothetical protein